MVPKHPLKQAADGISLMTFFTLLWAGLAAFALKGRDHWMLGIVFGVIVLLFLFYYLKFTAAEKKLTALMKAGEAGKDDTPEEDPEKKKEGNRFIILFIIEAVAILVVKNVLVNTGLDDYFIPCFALIVGLHFFPLARIFRRNFDYYVGGWTSLIAIAGIVLTYQRTWPPYLITALVATGCALATTANGIRMILQGNRLSYDDSIAIL